MTHNSALSVKDTTANPAPLGLFGFGMTTILLNLHNTGLFEMNAMILGMGIFYGGLAQVCAGVLEAKKGNTFGLTAFTSYGFFWLSLVALIVLPKLGWMAAPSNSAMAAYLAIWGIFTSLLFIGTIRISRALQVVFASLTVLFFLLAIGDATESITLKHFAGVDGIFCGLAAVYTGAAQVINEVYGKTILPLGPIEKLGPIQLTRNSKESSIVN
jgi:uncharacterized protein